MILAIVQARMSSTRFPGKVMKEILGKPLIGYLLERLSFSKKIEKIIVAAPEAALNDGLCQYIERVGYEVCRGSEHDVLGRFYYAAHRLRPEVIVRITADCPLIDPQVVDKVIQYYLENAFDYVSNVNPATFPDGLDTEVFSYHALKKAYHEATEAREREHVTPYMRNKDKFKIGNVECEKDYSGERWTVDYPMDFEFIKDVIENVVSKRIDCGYQDILSYTQRHPDVFRNNHLYSG